MKKNYFMKPLFTLTLLTLFSFKVNAQLRIVEVNPATETIKIHNYGATAVDISTYRLCSLITYRTLNTQTTVQSGSLNLAANATVVVTVNDAYLNDTAADLGLYLPSGSFGSAANMVDFTQWGSGGNGRENVAVTKGIWAVGTFISDPAPYEYIGNGSQNGFQFWDTLLNVENFENATRFKVYPNPSTSTLNIQLKQGVLNSQIEIFDILGKRVINQILGAEGFSTINVSELNSGLYLIKVSSDGISETKRFIKN